MQRKTFLFLAMSVFLGVLGATSNDLSESGLLHGCQAIVMLLVLLWLIYLAASGLLRHDVRITKRIASFIGRPCGALGVVLLAWILASPLLPDAARLYFIAHRPHIEGHWITDSNSHVQYYPLSYALIDQNKGRIPLFFLAFDPDRKFKFVPFSDQLASPSCTGAKYSARALTGQVYLVRAFVDDPGEELEPCLVTPSPADKSP